MYDLISELFSTAASLKTKLANDTTFLNTVEQGAQAICDVVERAGTVYACGNGGSACDAMHLTEELVARYKRERRGIRAQHFCDPGTLTCWGNDYTFDSAFARQVETFCTPQDLFVAISTSGNSPNVVSAAESASSIGCPIVALTGKSGGALAQVADVAIIVPSEETERIQEIHITCIHIFIETMEQKLFPSS